MPFPRHASRRPATRRLPAIPLIAFVVVVLGAASAVAAVGATTATADVTGNFTTTVTLSPSVAPGTYDITGRCGGGNLGVSASLTIAPTPVEIPPRLTG